MDLQLAQSDTVTVNIKPVTGGSCLIHHITGKPEINCVKIKWIGNRINNSQLDERQLGEGVAVDQVDRVVCQQPTQTHLNASVRLFSITNDFGYEIAMDWLYR